MRVRVVLKESGGRQPGMNNNKDHLHQSHGEKGDDIHSCVLMREMPLNPGD